MLCIWWDHWTIIHFEFLNHNQILNADFYCQQLQHVRESHLRKHTSLVGRRNVMHLHDNAWLHSAKITQEKILDLDWSVLPHPPYSPDLAPSDIHLFLFSKKCFEPQKISSRRSGKNVYGKLVELETRWILLERNQQASGGQAESLSPL